MTSSPMGKPRARVTPAMQQGVEDPARRSGMLPWPTKERSLGSGSVRYNDNPEIVAVLLKAGADRKAKNNNGETALDCAPGISTRHRRPEATRRSVQASSWSEQTAGRKGGMGATT